MYMSRGHAIRCRRGSVAGAFKIVYNLFNNFSEVLKVCVPALAGLWYTYLQRAATKPPASCQMPMGNASCSRSGSSRDQHLDALLLRKPLDQVR